MAVVLTCQSLSKSFGARRLFEALSLTIDDGERMGLLGPNGGGKSTLLEILAGRQEADRGTVALRKLARVGYVPQDTAFAPGLTVREVLTEAASTLPGGSDEQDARVEIMLGRAGFRDGAAQAAALSGGWRKRLALARELVRSPDLLLLDEPTNHLDLDGIAWLENVLVESDAACVVVSHDRYFLENVATHTAEINPVFPEGIFIVAGNYSEFLLRKEEFLEAQARRQESLAAQVRRQVEWLRRGPRARTGKAKARIDEAQRLIGDLAAVTQRQVSSTAQIDFTASGRQTRRLVVGESLSVSMAGRVLFQGLDFVLTAGSRTGLLGPNGSGKTTLLRLLTGDLPPDAGSVQRADWLKVVCFDQNRNETLDSTLTLRRALCPEGDSVRYRGRPIHVNGWAKRFLFRPEQMEMQVGSLSGGERARVLIARRMLEEADLLLLDEPTNDLDIPTLEVLEESLLEFPGALVLVTHDRYLLDRVCTAVIGLDGEGGAGVFADYRQWEAWRQERREARAAQARPATRPAPAPQAPSRKKLSYREQREWDSMEQRILEAETELAAHQRALEDPDVARDATRLREEYQALQAAQSRVEALYARWAELEGKAG